MSALTLTLTLKQHYNKKRETSTPTPTSAPLFTDTSTKFFFSRCKVSTIVRKLQPARPLGSLFRRSVGRTCLSIFFSAVSCRAFLEPCRVNVKRLLPINGGIHDALTTIREAYMTVLNKNSKMEEKSEVCKQ